MGATTRYPEPFPDVARPLRSDEGEHTGKTLGTASQTPHVGAFCLQEQ